MKTKDLVLCGLFAAVIAIMAQISIPLPGGVPLTLQTFAVALAGIILGAKRGFIATAVYVLLGAVGVPVFAELSGGLSIVVGATGGFILSFPIMAYIVGYVTEKTTNYVWVFVGILVGSIVNFVLGTAQLMFVLDMNLGAAITVAVLPFIPTTIIKALIATPLGVQVKKQLSRQGSLTA